MKKVSKIFYILAVLLSDAMCAMIAYQYAELKYGAFYNGYSAPPYAAFMWAVPFVILIGICLLLAEKNGSKDKG